MSRRLTASLANAPEAMQQPDAPATRHMRRSVPLFAAILLMLCALPLRADFDQLARTVERRSGAKRIWIPFFGVARFVVHVSHPKGVHDVKLATFEGGSFRGPILDASDILGEGFRPLVQVQTKRAGESTFVYARAAAGDLMTLLIYTRDAADTTLVEVTVDPEGLARALQEPGHLHRQRW